MAARKPLPRPMAEKQLEEDENECAMSESAIMVAAKIATNDQDPDLLDFVGYVCGAGVVGRIMDSAEDGMTASRVNVAAERAAARHSGDPAKAVEMYRRSAKAGNANAMFNLGACYAFGRGVPCDTAQAHQWWERAAAGGSVDAMYNMGVSYACGEGVEVDMARACSYWERAARRGNRDARYALGQCCEAGDGVAADPDRAMELYLLAAKQGHADAACSYARLCETGHHGDKALACKYYRVAAAADCAEAKYRLALMFMRDDAVPESTDDIGALVRDAALAGCRDAALKYMEMLRSGTYVQRDPDMALKIAQLLTSSEGEPAVQIGWLSRRHTFNRARPGSRADLVAALMDLARRFQTGSGTPKSMHAAFMLWRRAAAHSSVVARFNVGLCYVRGAGVERSYSAAAAEFKKAAEYGYGPALNALGVMHQKGYGVPRDLSAAIAHFETAIKYGSTTAKCNLAYLYFVGLGTRPDKRKAFELWKEAADKHRHPTAAFNVAICYKQGSGVEKDLAAADQYFRVCHGAL